MAAKSERSAKLSVLDRLIDQDPSRNSEAPMSPAQSLRELKTSLRRDMEWLLNTRQLADELPAGSNQLQRSLHVYGLPDTCSMSLSSSQDYHRLARTMETAIATFEPRLRSIRVKPSATSEAGSRTMRFQIEAVLRLEPVPEQITFDTVLELSSGEYEIKGDPGA